MFKKILVCLDGSKSAEQALPFAVSEARDYGGEITILRVNLLSRFLPVWASGGPPQQVVFIPPAMLEEELAKETALEKAYIDAVAAQVRIVGIDAASILLTALPSEVAETIVDWAVDNEVSLIVMATRGRPWWRRLFAGSVTAAVARRSPVPVLVVWQTVSAMGTDDGRAPDYQTPAGEAVGDFQVEVE